MNTIARILICAFLVLVVVVGLLFMMSYFKFQATLAALIQSRISSVGITIGESLENTVDLGLRLPEVRNADALIARARRHDAGITSIHIFDAGGRILFSTSEGVDGDALPRDVHRAWEKSLPGGGSPGLETDQGLVGVVPLTNSFGQTIGGIAVTYSKAGFHEQVATLTRALLRSTGLVLVGCGVLALIGVRIGFRDLRRDMDGIRAALRARRDAAPARAAAGAGGARPAHPGAAFAIGDFEHRLAASEAELAAAMTSLDDVERNVVRAPAPP